jgi:hypothetical protein
MAVAGRIRADTVAELQRLHQSHCRKRAEGGWWALSGFSFQAAVYLRRFVEGLPSSQAEPADLAKTEQLSDIFQPTGPNAFTLVQVKRSLDRDKLRSALEEAYEITRLCSPTLLDQIRFQIVCRKNEKNVSLTDIETRKPTKKNLEPAIWKKMLNRFDHETPIIVDHDPLDRLHYVLWKLGVRNSQHFVEECHGKLLGAFFDPGQSEIDKLARDIAGVFYTYKEKWSTVDQPPGLLLRARHFAADPNAAHDKEIFIQRQPRLLDIRLGRFRDRSITKRLKEQFDAWWLEAASRDTIEKVPVFWIGGRSGDGKSVLLLQLLARIMGPAAAPPVVLLDTATDLPRWLEQEKTRQRGLSLPPSELVVVVIDDIHDLADLDDWAQRIREICRWDVPRVGVLAAGPTLEREAFSGGLNEVCEITEFPVPHLNNAESEAFLHWARERSGAAIDLAIAPASNKPLVQWLFEVSKNQTLGAFAQGFERRLKRLQLLEVARAIMAVNVLDVPAAAELLSSDGERDALEALCREDQLHFEFLKRASATAPCGYRLAHPGLVWPLYRELGRPIGSSLARAWARDLSVSLETALAGNDFNHASLILFRLGHTDRLPEDEAQQAMAEVYRKHVQERVDKRPPLALAMVPRFLEWLCDHPGLELLPDPVHLLSALFLQEEWPAEVPAYSAAWLWRLSDRSDWATSADALRTMARRLLFSGRPRPGSSAAVVHLVAVAKDQQIATALALKWIESNVRDILAYRPLALLVARQPHRPDIRDAAVKWLTDNPTHPHAYSLHAPLVANWPQDAAVRDAAVKWLTDNPTHPHAYSLHAPLVANWPQDAAVRDAAVEWLADNPTHPNAQKLHAPLVANWPHDPTVRDAAVKWLTDNPAHPNAYELISTLIVRSDGAPQWVELGEAFVEEALHLGQAAPVLAALLSSSKAAPKRIEQVIDRLNNPEWRRAHNYLKLQLSRVLASNIDNALSYITDYQHEAIGDLVVDHFAYGLKKYGNRAQELIEKIERCPLRFRGKLLASCLYSDLQGPALDSAVANFFIQNFRRPGYGVLLRALRNRLADRPGSIDLTLLNKDVQQDFDELLGEPAKRDLHASD